MEAVLAQLVLLGDGGRDGVGADMFGDGLVELAVEDGNVVGGGEVGEEVLDDFEGGCVVEGCEVGEGFEVVV